MSHVVRAAIVDDVEEARASIVSLLRTYMEKNKETVFDMTEFSNGMDFIDHYKPIFDIVFMDIEMPHYDGIRIAHELRNYDNSSVLIFITNKPQYAIKGYEVDALMYMVKPVKYPTFAFTMDKALKSIFQSCGHYVLLPYEEGQIRLSEKDIFYVTVRNHEIYCHTSNGIIHVFKTLNEMEELLSGPPYDFIRVHRGYLVNPTYIRHIGANSVRIGVISEDIPMSRDKKSEVMQKFMQHLERGR